jgi:hypothetical protein
LPVYSFTGSVSDSSLPQSGGQVSIFKSPRNWVAQLYPQALGSLSVTFYDLQGYGGSDLTRLHTLEGQSAMPWCVNSRWTEYKQCPQQCLHFLHSYSLLHGHKLVQCHITTDGQLASLPRNKAPIWGPWPDIHHCQTVVNTPMRDAPPQKEEMHVDLRWFEVG